MSTVTDGQGADPDPEDSLESLRARCESLREENARLSQLLDEIAGVINGRPDKVLHDVRNVMNELVLLRKLVDDEQ